MGVEGYHLDKTERLLSSTQLDRLTKHVRSMHNPGGLLEYQKIDQYRNVLYTPPMEPPVEFYTRDQLFEKKRSDLEKIAEALLLDTVAIKDDILIKKILQEQAKYRVSESVSP